MSIPARSMSPLRALSVALGLASSGVLQAIPCVRCVIISGVNCFSKLSGRRFLSASYSVLTSMSLSGYTLVTVIMFRVSVPVLSEQISVAPPIISQAASLFT